MTNYSPLLALFVLAPRLRRASNRALSIYLPARSEGYDARFYDIEFRDLLHRYQHRVTAKDHDSGKVWVFAHSAKLTGYKQAPDGIIRLQDMQLAP